jgi:hypothetical protein
VGHETAFKANAWARAKVQSVDISGALFGCEHVFQHDGRIVHISIPKVSLDDTFQTVGRSTEFAFQCSRRTDEPTLETSTYHLWLLEITIEIPDLISVPVALLSTPPKRPDLAGDLRTEQLDKLASEYNERMTAAFDHWQATTRWITSSSRLGCSELTIVSNSDALEFPRLVRAADRQAFWLPTQYGAVARGTKINIPLWQAIGSALESGLEAPLWFRYLDEGYRNGVERDLAGSILSCAIACETLAREALWLRTGATDSEEARELLDRVPVRSILGKWAKLTSIPKTKSRIADIAELFTVRNRLMHVGGRGQGLSDRLVRRFFHAARAFVWSGDEWYFRFLGTGNPRPPGTQDAEEHLWPRTSREYHQTKK